MKYVICMIVLIYGQLNAQVPLVLNGTNTEYFKVFVFEIKHHIENDSIKVDGFVHSNVEVRSSGDLTYEVNLPTKNWYLINFVDIDKRSKVLIIRTGDHNLTEPMVFKADFNTKNDCFVDYNPINDIYSQTIFSLKD